MRFIQFIRLNRTFSDIKEKSEIFANRQEEENLVLVEIERSIFATNPERFHFVIFIFIVCPMGSLEILNVCTCCSNLEFRILFCMCFFFCCIHVSINNFYLLLLCIFYEITFLVKLTIFNNNFINYQIYTYLIICMFFFICKLYFDKI